MFTFDEHCQRGHVFCIVVGVELHRGQTQSCLSYVMLFQNQCTLTLHKLDTLKKKNPQCEVERDFQLSKHQQNWD